MSEVKPQAGTLALLEGELAKLPQGFMQSLATDDVDPDRVGLYHTTEGHHKRRACDLGDLRAMARVVILTRSLLNQLQLKREADMPKAKDDAIAPVIVGEIDDALLAEWKRLVSEVNRMAARAAIDPTFSAEHGLTIRDVDLRNGLDTRVAWLKAAAKKLIPPQFAWGVATAVGGYAYLVLSHINPPSPAEPPS